MGKQLAPLSNNWVCTPALVLLGAARSAEPMTTRPMRRMTPQSIAVGLWLVTTAFVANGQTLTKLIDFDGANGAAPNYESLIQGLDGRFYGTTTAGGGSSNCKGGCGTIFAITSMGDLIKLHSFQSTDGASPYAGLVQAFDGSFYGTTEAGGANGYGTVFKFASHELETLHSFNLADGANPWAALSFGPGGDLFGNTYYGGPAPLGCNGGGCGTIFTVTPDGTFTSLYSISNSDGAYPDGALILGADGKFYGTTLAGVAYGTIFTITPGGTLTTIYSFSPVDGEWPSAPLTQGADGDFYGATGQGGSALGGGGTVYKITPAGITVLYAANGDQGVGPNPGLVAGYRRQFLWHY
jgi:uncharacterized repeat protein (TIGR03803 family)